VVGRATGATIGRHELPHTDGVGNVHDVRDDGWVRPAGAPSVLVRTGEDEAGAVLALAGEIDAPDGDAIRPLLLDVLLGTEHRTVTLDLSAVTFLGSRGLALIVTAERVAERRGLRLRGIAGIGNLRVLRPMRLTGVGGSVVWVDRTAA
jgi:anti-sigma B factor antagonist